VPPPFYTFVGIVSWPVTKFAYRLRAKGVEHVPKDGGFVLAANHTSNFDPWPLGIPLFPRRALRFMAKIELFNPALGPFLKMAGAFPVRRGQADVEAIETAVRLVREGEVVVMFPEGTRRRKGLRKKFTPTPHTGAARIALAAPAPLVPAAISGTDRLARLGPLRVAYGPAIQVDDLEELAPREAAQVATDRLMQEIERLHATL
jgi:1-acyl-sn-glycerol-3-phosphate acyltransferase